MCMYVCVSMCVSVCVWYLSMYLALVFVQDGFEGGGLGYHGHASHRIGHLS